MSQTAQNPDETNPGKAASPSDGSEVELQYAQEKLRYFRGIPVELSIELGKGKLRLRDLLGLRYHSIFELDKIAGSNLDLYINGILLARGEPVIQEDRIRIKINEIVDLQR